MYFYSTLVTNLQQQFDGVFHLNISRKLVLILHLNLQILAPRFKSTKAKPQSVFTTYILSWHYVLLDALHANASHIINRYDVFRFDTNPHL